MQTTPPRLRYIGIGIGQYAEALPLTHSKLFSDAVKEYFTHYAHRGSRTNQEKQLGFRRFIEIIGSNRPVQDIREVDCIKFRRPFSRFLVAPPINFEVNP